MRVRWFTTIFTASLLEMDRLQAAPCVLEVGADESPVAVIRRGFAAEKDRWHREESGADLLFDLPLGHELQEAPLVVLPAPLPFLVGVEHVLGRRQQGLMEILSAADLAQEEGKVVALGKPGQLRRVVQPHVDKAPDPGASQRSEEVRGGSLRKTDRVDFHCLTSSSGNSVSWLPARRGASVAPNSSSRCRLPSARMCSTVVPLAARTRPIRSRRWQPAGSSSAHIAATRYFPIPCSSRVIPSRNRGDSATRS